MLHKKSATYQLSHSSETIYAFIVYQHHPYTADLLFIQVGRFDGVASNENHPHESLRITLDAKA